MSERKIHVVVKDSALHERTSKSEVRIHGGGKARVAVIRMAECSTAHDVYTSGQLLKCLVKDGKADVGIVLAQGEEFELWEEA